MIDVINYYKETFPAVRFIGKQYGDGDRGTDGGFGRQWDEWWSKGWFDILEKAAGPDWGSKYTEGPDTIGLMRWKEKEPFQYWIGMFVPEDTAVPEGFDSMEFPEGTLGTCWLKGREHEVFGHEDLCAKKLGEQGCKIIPDSLGAWWFFERYQCPRFTQPDEQGNIILDICHFIA